MSQTLGDIRYLGVEDEAQLVSWDSGNHRVVEECLHEMVSRTVKANPGECAAHAWDGQLSYQELDKYSSRVAHRLVKEGLLPESYVPFCFEKTVWASVAILGILKAGGVCVALDPSHPASRWQSILQQIDPPIALTSAKHAGALDGLLDRKLVVTQAALEACEEVEGFECPTVRPQQAAFAVFTSGSTGEPKGVILEHRTLTTSLLEIGKVVKLAKSRVLQFAAHVWDHSILEIMGTLIHGGCVCIPSDDQRMNSLTQTIDNMRVSWAFFTPTLARTLRSDSTPTLDVVVVGGEAVGQDIIEQWAAKVDLFEAYGPTECAIYTTIQPLTRGSRGDNVGKPVIGSCWIADRSCPDRLAPIGAFGEILVEGPILARGYLKDPEKTASAFLTNPQWAQGQPRRVYRTGDLGRYASDGSIVYGGRRDLRVKVRGQLLDLAEIEHHLSQTGDIRHAVVNYPRSGPWKRRVVVVFTPRSFSKSGVAPRDFALCAIANRGYTIPCVQEIEQYLEQRLPAHGVPDVFIAVETIPLATSGKLDRQKTVSWLVNMSREMADSISALHQDLNFDHPITEVELILQQLWSEILNISKDRINRSSSFFRLGGDSISAMQLVAKCRANGFTSITVQDILRRKTIQQLAPKLLNQSIGIVKLKEQMNTLFDLSPIQTMHMERCSTGTESFYQDFLLQSHVEVPPHVISAALEKIMGSHSMLRAQFKRTNTGSWQQLITSKSEESLHINSYEVARVEQVGPMIRQVSTSLNVETGPVFSAAVFNVEGENPLIFLSAHHLVIDLVSWRIILDDLETLLRGAMPLPTSMPFQTWVRSQARHFSENIQIQDVIPFQVPASDYDYWGMEGRPNFDDQNKFERFSLDKETSAAFSRANEIFRTETLDILLSSLLHAFSKVFSDRVAPAVFNEGHGREPWDSNIDLSRTVGWFTTVYPVAISQNGLADAVESLREVKDTRRRIPSNGWAYFSWLFLNQGSGPASRKKHWPPEIIFNFIGSYQQLERFDRILSEINLDRDHIDTTIETKSMQRFSLFECTSRIDHGVLTVSLTWNRQMKHQDRIHQWMVEFRRTLESLPFEVLQRRPEFTVGDFPLSKFQPADMQNLTSKVLPSLGLIDLDAIEAVYPCVPMQAGIMMARMKSKGYYCVCETSKISPSSGSQRIDSGSVARAWQDVVDRHQILRTIFWECPTIMGPFQQIVLRQHKARKVLLYATEDAEGLRLITVSNPAEHEGLQPHHQISICQVSNGTVFCKLELSHALIDAVSMATLWDELRLAYEHKLPRGPGPSYGDYVSHIYCQPRPSTVEYWKDYLQDVQPCLFPTTEPHGHASGEIKTIVVPQCDAKRAHQFCKSYGLTVANLFQGVWALVLRSYTSTDSICFGYLASGRELPIQQVSEIVGPLINMMICRVEMAGSFKVLDMLSKIQADHIESLPHQITQLGEIHHALGLGEDKLFNTALSVQSTGSPRSFQPSPEEHVHITPLGGEDPTEVRKRRSPVFQR